MLSSRWNQVKDPEAKESLRLIEQAINQGFAALGIDPLPSQQNQTAQGGSPITAPQPPLALAVSSVSGGVLVQIAANPANIKPVNYFVETSASASFTNVTVYRFGLLQTDTINIGTATLFFRCRCQYFSSAFSAYALFGNPTAVTGGSSSLGSTTGSGAVVLQTSPTIITPTIAQINSLNLTAAGAGDTVTLLNQQGPAAAITGTGADVNVFTYTMPGNTMAAGKGIRVWVAWQHTSGNATVTYTMKFGGGVFNVISDAGTGFAQTRYDIFNNPGVQNAQICLIAIQTSGTTINGPGAVTSSAIDTTAAVTISFTFNVANTDQVTPKFWVVELIQ